MSLKIKCFGLLTGIMGDDALEIEHVADTYELQQKLLERYPALGSATYRMAVGKKMITRNTPLSNGDEVALLPPFSGG